MKKLFYLLLMFVGTTLVAQEGNWESKIDAEVWGAASQQISFEFFILLKEQARTQEAKKMSTKEAKANYVFRQLRDKAAQTQGELLQIIQQHQAAYKPYWVVNGIWVKGDAQLMEILAKREEVRLIAPNPRVKNQLPQRATVTQWGNARGPKASEWGIGTIRADLLWNKNIKGAGVIIGGQDTGYEWWHPAIRDQYRGDTLDHNYHWHDAIHGQLSSSPVNSCGYDVNYPCDDGSHGTHTMGTMVGDDGAGNQIGVAPEAEWIGCRNMENGWGTPATYIECFEWFLAPTDTNNLNPNPAMAPHVIANSWGCPPVEGCNPSNFHIMQMVVENLKNAGIFIVVSAGNDGWNGCHSINSPAAIYEASFSVGATDILDTLANFSSRGSVTSDGSMRLKPNVVAPGVNVRSSVPGNGYAAYSGTSMAGPHVAGAVALLINAKPSLAGNVDSLETILEMTADSVYAHSYRSDTCGGTPKTVFPNNMVGYGRINLYKALKILRPDLMATIATIEPQDLMVYPNPFTDKVQLQTPDYMGNCRVTIANALGQTVQHFDTYFSTVLELDLTTLSSGVYVVRVENGQQKAVGKLVKY